MASGDPQEVRCPHCGHCKHCGAPQTPYYPYPWGLWPYWPYWQQVPPYTYDVPHYSPITITYTSTAGINGLGPST